MSSGSLLARVNTPRSDEDRLKHIELMKICTTLQKKVLDQEDELNGTKTAQQTKIDGLERRVRKLEKKHRSRTHKLKRLYKVGLTARLISSSDDKALDKEDTSKQGMIDEIDADEDIAIVSTHDDVSIQDEGIEDVGEKEVVEVVTTVKMLIDTVVDLQAEIDEENRIAREKAQQVEEVNLSWGDVYAKIKADYQLAQRLQAEEQEQLIDAEKAKLFMEFLEKGRKFFAAKRAEEKRNRLPTKAQQRKLFDKAMKRINTFVDFRTELVEETTKKDETETVQESSSKKTRDDLEQERSRKQKTEKDKESAELKKCLEIVPDNGDEVTIDATHLSSKSSTIVEYRIYKEGKKNYF
nr:hypothetical protein [Tanacetum cinerariifolium]